MSRVLRESARVSPDVAQRVRDAAASLGMSVQALGKHRAIVFLLANRAITHPFHSHVMLGAEAYCAEHNYHVLFMTAHYPLRGPVYQLPTSGVLDRKGLVDGFIVAGVNSPALIDLLVGTRLPCAVFGNTLTEEGVPAACSTVKVDDRMGSADMTRHLIELGHRSIGWVGNASQVWFRSRAEGYREAMLSAGLEPRIVSVEAEDEQQVGDLATRSLLTLGPRPTAIVSGNDRVAHGVYDALRDFHLIVGKDISVAGFNDTLEAIVLHPTLTTMRVFAEQIGRKLAELTVARIEDPNAPIEHVTLPTRLIRRDSCAGVTGSPS